ncbi:hypothetical protein [Gilliamella sp. Nev3-1]|uniref:hypothetical protein n=1 Tax=Gilliamella sp. Nev3-1 TaxID=3120250 RepID=UPI00159EF2BC|nr:hypothetical protein [Gilliamella apicola]
MNSIDIIKNYLEGSLSPQDFQKELYYNKDMENLLSKETQIVNTPNLVHNSRRKLSCLF